MDQSRSTTKKMALEMLILKKSGKSTDKSISSLVRALPKGLSVGVKDELKNMDGLSSESL